MIWSVIAVAGLFVGLALAFSLLCWAVEARAMRMERRGREIVAWAVERVSRASIRAMKAGKADGRLSPEEVGTNHAFVVARALKMAQAENFDLVKALGGQEALAACAWVGLAGRV